MASSSSSYITRAAFFQSVLILFIFMLLAGGLTRVLPAGRFERVTIQGREMVQPDSFQNVDKPDYPIWRWFTAPLEVLWGPDALTVITIIVFILLVGGAFTVLEEVGALQAGLRHLVSAFGDRKYALLLAVSFSFMVLGAFFGILEEVVPLVPLALALSASLGWDPLVGLGMSILATNLGFSAAITNPFTIGVAQELAGLPLFSGAWFRIPIFVVIYLIFAVFLTRYARRIEKHPRRSLVYEEMQGQSDSQEYSRQSLFDDDDQPPRRAVWWLVVCLGAILITLIAAPFLPFLASYALPIVGVLFFTAGLGAGLLSNTDHTRVFQALGMGMAGIAPGVLLILMAVSIKHIVVQGGIMDTLLHSASGTFTKAGPFASALIIYGLALAIEFLVASGSAKAFLLMPILLPLADVVGVTRQVAVTAYSFGDGFSNTIYPTNPILLIVLGLTVVSYPKWLRWTLPLWGVILLVTVLFLGIAVAIGYGAV